MRRQRLLRMSALLVVGACAASSVVMPDPGLIASARAAEGDTAANLVLVRPGTLPILLTVPHGGREVIPGIEERDAGNKAGRRVAGKWSSFVKGADTDTDLLAQRIAAEIEALTGDTPYVVLAKFRRGYIDANRPPDIALDSPQARPYYERYHEAIRRFVDEIRSKYPAGLLIDVHGQHLNADVVMRGTINGKTVARLIQRAGFDAVTGPKGIFGQLEVHGFTVFPRNDVPPRGTAENAGLNGGYTVAIYGSEARDGIDAVQMEFGTRYRLKAALDDSGRRAGRAIAGFYEAYLKAQGGPSGRPEPVRR